LKRAEASEELIGVSEAVVNPDAHLVHVTRRFLGCRQVLELRC